MREVKRLAYFGKKGEKGKQDCGELGRKIQERKGGGGYWLLIWGKGGAKLQGGADAKWQEKKKGLKKVIFVKGGKRGARI